MKISTLAVLTALMVCLMVGGFIVALPDGITAIEKHHAAIDAVFYATSTD